MRTTLTIDDDLLQQAQQYMLGVDKTALVREGLRALIQRESSRRLALLGGTEQQLKSTPRRRDKAAA
jgi:Arc/MetJ family transcription regulator